MLLVMRYAAALFLSTLIASIIAGMAWRRRTAPGATGLLAVMVSAALWAGAYGIRWLQTDEPAMLFWLDATYLGVVFGPTAMLCMAIQFLNGTNALSPRAIFLLGVMPVITLGLIWTDTYHGLFYGGLRTTSAILDGGAWFFVNAVYLYILNFTSFFLLLRRAINAKGLYARQIVIMLIGLAFPWVGNILSLAGLSPLPGLDLTPFLFVASGAVFAYGLFHFKLLDIVPIARHFLVEHMSEGLIVVDERNRIVDMNPSACSIFDTRFSNVGEYFSQILSRWEAAGNIIFKTANEGFELRKDKLWFDVQVSTFNEEQLHLKGKIFMIRDVSRQRQIMDELKYRSSHDMLTGLLNRHQYETEVERLELCASEISILMVDLDDLKSLNDIYGHEAGDRMLCDTASILKSSAAQPMIVARVGGDEFVVLLESCDEEGAKAALDAILYRVDQFNAECIEGKAGDLERPCPLSLSIGRATRMKGEPLKATIKRADDAMYVEKNLKKPLVSRTL